MRENGSIDAPPPASAELQSFYPTQFVRDTGCTETEWLGWLPGAVGGRRLVIEGRTARVDLEDGHLALHWEVLPPRRIALMQLPHMQVSYAFESRSESGRLAFMRHFDLYMQRGGG